MQGSFFVRIRRILRGRFVPATGPAASPSPFRYGVGHNPRRARAVPGFVPERLQVRLSRGSCNGIRPNMRESCIAIALGGMFRTFCRLSRNRNLSGSVPEGLFMGPPSFFFGGSFASERSIRVSVPGARSVGCMRRTPECPSILPVSSRSPDRTDPKTHARRKSRTKMQ